MHAVRPGFLTANAQIHPITAPATYVRSLVPVPNDQRAEKPWSRQIAAPSSPAASKPCVHRESDGQRHRTRSKCFHLHFGMSTFPVDHAEAHSERRACEREAILCAASYVPSCSSIRRQRFSPAFWSATPRNNLAHAPRCGGAEALHQPSDRAPKDPFATA